MAAPPDNVIEYAPVKPRPWPRGLLWIISLIVLLGFLRWKGPAIYECTRILYFQHECAIYTDSPATVAYDESPTRAPALLATRGYIDFPSRDPAATGIAARPTNLWAKAAGRGVLTIQPPWAALLFLHERISSTGIRRLVCIELDDREPPRLYDAATGQSYIVISIHTSLREPNTIFHEAWPVGDSGNGTILDLPIGASNLNLRFFAGQPDPADHSKFTIDYERDGIRHTITGILQPDGNSVHFDNVPDDYPSPPVAPAPL